MPKRSESTDVVLEIADELETLRKDAEKTARHAIPFMEERLSKDDAIGRIQRMTPQQREHLLAEKGQKEILNIVRRRK